MDFCPWVGGLGGHFPPPFIAPAARLFSVSKSLRRDAQRAWLGRGDRRRDLLGRCWPNAFSNYRAHLRPALRLHALLDRVHDVDDLWRGALLPSRLSPLARAVRPWPGDIL